MSTLPEARFGHHSIIQVARSRMLVWGGISPQNQLLNDVISIYNLSTRRWSIQKAIGEVPVPCFLANSASREPHRFVYQFGGTRFIGRKREYLNDVHVLDTERLAWRRMRVVGSLNPSGRSSAGLCLLRNRLILFGGLSWKLDGAVNEHFGWNQYPTGEDGLNRWWNDQLWELDVSVFSQDFSSSVSWKPVECPAADTRPSARCDHSFTALDDSRALLHGGIGPDIHSKEFWLFDYDNKLWSNLPVLVNLPRAIRRRGEHAAVTVCHPAFGLLVFFLGGCNEHYAIVRDGFYLKIGDAGECHEIRLTSSATKIGRSSTICSILWPTGEIYFLLFGGSSHEMFSPNDHADLQLTLLKWNPARPTELEPVLEDDDIVPSLSESSGSFSSGIPKGSSEAVPVLPTQPQPENQPALYSSFYKKKGSESKSFLLTKESAVGQNAQSLSGDDDSDLQTFQQEQIMEAKEAQAQAVVVDPPEEAQAQAVVLDPPRPPTYSTSSGSKPDDLPLFISVDLDGLVLRFNRVPELDFFKEVNHRGDLLIMEGTSTSITIPPAAISEGNVLTIGCAIYSLDKDSVEKVDRIAVFVSDMLALYPSGVEFDRTVTVNFDHGTNIQESDDFVATVMHRALGDETFSDSVDITKLGQNVSIDRGIQVTLLDDRLSFRRRHFCEELLRVQFREQGGRPSFRCVAIERTIEPGQWAFDVFFCRHFESHVQRVKQANELRNFCVMRSQHMRLSVSEGTRNVVAVTCLTPNWKAAPEYRHTIVIPNEDMLDAFSDPEKAKSYSFCFLGDLPLSEVDSTVSVTVCTLRSEINVSSCRRNESVKVNSSQSVSPVPATVRLPEGPTRLPADRKITNVDIYKLAPLIAPDWKDVARFLIPEERIQSDLVTTEAGARTPQDLAHHMLVFWLTNYSDEATASTLRDALQDNDSLGVWEAVFPDLMSQEQRPLQSGRIMSRGPPERKPTDREMNKLSRKISAVWRPLATALGIPYDICARIRRNYRDDVREQAFEMLMWWRNAVSEASVGGLLEALREEHLEGAAQGIF